MNPSTEPETLLNVETKAIFFDFDGVLVSSLDIKTKLFVALFENQPRATKDAIETYFREFTGHSRQRKLAHIFGEILGIEENSALVQLYAERYKKGTIDAVVACPEVNGASRLLAAIPGSIKKFVISGTPEKELLEICEKRRAHPHFDEILGTPVTKEEHMSRLLDSYKLPPEHCVMIGDGKVDYQAAIASQVKFIGVVKEGGTNPFPKDIPIVGDMQDLLFRSTYYGTTEELASSA